MADDTKAVADKAAAEKLAAENQAAVEKAAADQQAANKAALAAQAKAPIVVVGRAGGAFTIDGPGLGPSGTLVIGGRLIPTTRWDDKSVRGQLPEAISGAVVFTNEKGVRHGIFPQK